MTTLEVMIHRNVLVEVGKSRCSGIVLSKGIVLTVFHALEDNSPVFVNGTEAVAILINPEKDLMLLRAETEDLPPVTFGTSVNVTTPVIQVGNPYRLNHVISRGYVIATEESLLFTDTLAMYGFSGGGLYTEDGVLIGIVQGMLGGNQGSWIIASLKSEEVIKVLRERIK